MKALNDGARPEDVKTSFVHPEPGGVLSITEKGAGRNAIPLRLYIFPDTSTQSVMLLTLGDKETQQDDVQFCTKSLTFLREGSTQDVQGKGLP
jgi:hypothetical protein